MQHWCCASSALLWCKVLQVLLLTVGSRRMRPKLVMKTSSPASLYSRNFGGR